MMLYPNVQLAARAEIDRVVGRDRLPELGDLESLPYVTATVKEVLRSVYPSMVPVDNIYNENIPGGIRRCR